MMPRSAHTRRPIFSLDEDSIEVWAVAALLGMVLAAAGGKSVEAA